MRHKNKNYLGLLLEQPQKYTWRISDQNVHSAAEYYHEWMLAREVPPSHKETFWGHSLEHTAAPTVDTWFRMANFEANTAKRQKTFRSQFCEMTANRQKVREF
jgi:hypothetical protein